MMKIKMLLFQKVKYIFFLFLAVFWQFLAVLAIFGSFGNLWQFGHFSGSFDISNVVQIAIALLTVYDTYKTWFKSHFSVALFLAPV